MTKTQTHTETHTNTHTPHAARGQKVARHRLRNLPRPSEAFGGKGETPGVQHPPHLRSPPPRKHPVPLRVGPAAGATGGGLRRSGGTGADPAAWSNGSLVCCHLPRPANHGVSPACVARLRPRVAPELSAPLSLPGLSPRAALALPVPCRGALDFCFDKMAAALLLLRRRRRLRALGRRRRPLSLTERRGAGTRGAMAGGRRGAIARPE